MSRKSRALPPSLTAPWIVHPTGTPEQRATIEKAVELVRAEHPYIR